MNFYDNLKKFSSKVALITEQSNTISYKDLILEADHIGKYVKKRILTRKIQKSVSINLNEVDGIAIKWILNQRIFHVKIELKTKFQTAPTIAPNRDAKVHNPVFSKIRFPIEILAKAPKAQMK